MPPRSKPRGAERTISSLSRLIGSEERLEEELCVQLQGCFHQTSVHIAKKTGRISSTRDGSTKRVSTSSIRQKCSKASKSIYVKPTLTGCAGSRLTRGPRRPDVPFKYSGVEGTILLFYAQEAAQFSCQIHTCIPKGVSSNLGAA